MTKCQSCNQLRVTKTALVDGKYYKAVCAVCAGCLAGVENDISSNAAGYERRRGYEDNAQDTIQPYDANGKARVEFARLYPDAAKKTFGTQIFNELRAKI